ncbi:MAG: Do family serine endopeptidase [candidate division FCPU426 bacterium]
MKITVFLGLLALLPYGPVVAASEPLSFKETAKLIRPSVVNISTIKNVKTGMLFGGGPTGDPFFDRFFGGGLPRGEQTSKVRSLGSGVIIDAAQGYVLTNNHVVEDADEISVKLADKREMAAKIVGRDPKTDLAVLKIKNAQGLKAAPFGDSDLIEVGDWVLAVGSPFGLEQTVSHGIISAKGRVIGQGPYDDFLQTDAPINPGNSGGPLVDLNGAVVGINTAISSRSGGSEGVGFAIPANSARKIYGQLIAGGKITRGWLGISIQELEAPLAKYFGLPTGLSGAVVADVMEDGPAKKGGVLAGDVITEVNGKKVEGVRELQRVIADASVGRSVTLKVWRDKSWKTLNVSVGDMATFDGETQATKGGAAEQGRRLGIGVRTLAAEELRAQKGLDVGRVVVETVAPGGAAEAAGLQAGDLILDLDRVRIASAQQFGALTGKLKPGSAAVLRVNRGGRSLFLTLHVPESDQ